MKKFDYFAFFTLLFYCFLANVISFIFIYFFEKIEILIHLAAIKYYKSPSEYEKRSYLEEGLYVIGFCIFGIFIFPFLFAYAIVEFLKYYYFFIRNYASIPKLSALSKLLLVVFLLSPLLLFIITHYEFHSIFLFSLYQLAELVLNLDSINYNVFFQLMFYAFIANLLIFVFLALIAYVADKIAWEYDAIFYGFDIDELYEFLSKIRFSLLGIFILPYLFIKALFVFIIYFVFMPIQTFVLLLKTVTNYKKDFGKFLILFNFILISLALIIIFLFVYLAYHINFLSYFYELKNFIINIKNAKNFDFFFASMFYAFLLNVFSFFVISFQKYSYTFLSDKFDELDQISQENYENELKEEYKESKKHNTSFDKFTLYCALFDISPKEFDEISLEDLKKRYHKLARIFHPDIHKEENKKQEMQEKMKEINLAYEFLKKLKNQG